MDNEYNKAGAGKQFAIAPNQTYALMLANLSACGFGVANDRNAWMFQDNEGNTYKTLQDASGDDTLDQNSVPVIDSAGRATENANFRFNGTTLRLPMPGNIDFGDQTNVGDIRIAVEEGSLIIKRWNGSSYTEMFSAT